MGFRHLLTRCVVQINLSLNRSMATRTSATVTRVSKHLELHQYHPDTIDSGEPRPTLVFLPWMTATQSMANRYRELYAARGFNVLTAWGHLSYFMWPRWATPFAVELADYLDTQTIGPLLVHSMSVGSYLYAVTLCHISDNPDKYASLVSRVKGQVYDSIVIGGLKNMARGVGDVVFPNNPILQQAVGRACMLYFAATKQHTVTLYEKAIDVTFNSPIKTAKLCFHSSKDSLCCAEDFEQLMDYWRDKYDLYIMSYKWEDSPHASHLKTDPATYIRLLNEYLQNVGLGNIPTQLSSKM